MDLEKYDVTKHVPYMVWSVGLLKGDHNQLLFWYFLKILVRRLPLVNICR